MSGHPVVTGAGSGRDDLDDRGRHGLLDDDRLGRRDTGTNTDQQSGGASRPRQMARRFHHNEFSSFYVKGIWTPQRGQVSAAKLNQA
jgi:hypothetical protein